MNTMLSQATAVGAGAALMYFLDPDRGRRRRKLVLDQAVRAMHLSTDSLEATGRDLRHRAAGLAGAALAARGAANAELRRLLGLRGRRGVDVRKTITVNAPVDEVFEFWSRFENFPRFMSHVIEVRDLGAGRSRWTVVGPAGAPVRWQAVVTEVEPDEVLAWKSVDGALVRHAGRVHFRENPDRTTQIDVQLTYSPPAGALGHAVATVFGSDPKSALDDDLVRLKSLLEEGKATAHGREVTLAEVAPPAPAAAPPPQSREAAAAAEAAETMETVPAQAASAVARPGDLELTEGMPVFGSDGVQVGVIKEVRGHDFRLDRPEQPEQLDVYVPLEYVRDTAGARATLTVQSHEIGHMGWETPAQTRSESARDGYGGGYSTSASGR